MNISSVNTAIANDPVNEYRARRLAQLRERHWTMLWLSTAIVVFAFALQIAPSGHVAPSWAAYLSLPELCGSRALFGVECPGCGLTRSFIALAGGDFATSWNYHRIGWLLALAVVLQLPYRIFALRELRDGIVERSWPQWFGWAILALLFGNWLGKISGMF